MPPADDNRLTRLLTEHHPELVAFARREASGLLRFETADDLVQGMHARVLGESQEFEFLGEKEFFAWVHTVLRRHIADRHEYWSALKRGAGRIVRYTLGNASGTGTGVLLPAHTKPGPRTFAEQRELVALATRALGALPPRDRDLVRWESEGVDLGERAARLGISYAAAQRASLRAAERLRKAFELLSR